jgi:hypothetical protein
MRRARGRVLTAALVAISLALVIIGLRAWRRANPATSNGSIGYGGSDGAVLADPVDTRYLPEPVQPPNVVTGRQGGVETTSTGTCESADVQAALRAIHPQLAGCLEKGPFTLSRVTARLQVSPAGLVKVERMHAWSLDDAGTATGCVESALAALKLPHNEGGDCTADVGVGRVR